MSILGLLAVIARIGWNAGGVRGTLTLAPLPSPVLPLLVQLARVNRRLGLRRCPAPHPARLAHWFLPCDAMTGCPGMTGAARQRP
jgi:hypothetical protein